MQTWTDSCGWKNASRLYTKTTIRIYRDQHCASAAFTKCSANFQVLFISSFLLSSSSTLDLVPSPSRQIDHLRHAARRSHNDPSDISVAVVDLAMFFARRDQSPVARVELLFLAAAICLNAPATTRDAVNYRVLISWVRMGVSMLSSRRHLGHGRQGCTPSRVQSKASNHNAKQAITCWSLPSQTYRGDAQQTAFCHAQPSSCRTDAATPRPARHSAPCRLSGRLAVSSRSPNAR